MIFPLKNITLKTGELIEIESAKLTDSNSLWEFGHALAQDHEYQVIFPDEFTIKPEDEPKFIEDNLTHPMKLALVARHKGEVIALVTIAPISRLRKMSHVVSTSIGIVEDFRDKKLGRLLMTEALEFIKQNKSIEKVELHVLSTNTRAIQLYKNLGFTEAGRSKKQIKFSDADYADDVVMELLF